MRLSNERKVCAVIFSLAVAALAVDRLVLGGGSPRAAGAAEVVVQPAPAAPSTVPRAEAGRSALIPVARQFARLEVYTSNNADGFSAPERWRSAIDLEKAKSTIKPAAAPKAASSLSDTWPANKRLSAIMRGSDRTIALINGRSYEVGDELDGLVLAALDEKTGSARFAEPFGDEAVELFIPRPDVAKPSK